MGTFLTQSFIGIMPKAISYSYGEFYSYQAFCKQFGIHDPSLLTVIPAIVGNDAITQLDKNLLKIIMPENCSTDNPVENAVRYVATFSTFDSCLT